MSVIVVGMKMPKNCAECPCERYECLLLDKDAEDIMQYFTGDKRHPDCPLIDLPPHGDLIDRDELINFLYMQIFPKDITTVTAVNMAAGWLKECPVFIEAENEDV